MRNCYTYFKRNKLNIHIHATDNGGYQIFDALRVVVGFDANEQRVLARSIGQRRQRDRQRRGVDRGRRRRHGVSHALQVLAELTEQCGASIHNESPAQRQHDDEMNCRAHEAHDDRELHVGACHAGRHRAGERQQEELHGSVIAERQIEQRSPTKVRKREHCSATIHHYQSYEK
jgi:hypothetical protein